MAGVALLNATPNGRELTDEAIVTALDKHKSLCRCGTYPRIVAAIKDASRGGRA